MQQLDCCLFGEESCLPCAVAAHCIAVSQNLQAAEFCGDHSLDLEEVAASCRDLSSLSSIAGHRRSASRALLLTPPQDGGRRTKVRGGSHHLRNNILKLNHFFFQTSLIYKQNDSLQVRLRSRQRHHSQD